MAQSQADLAAGRCVAESAQAHLARLERLLESGGPATGTAAAREPSSTQKPARAGAAAPAKAAKTGKAAVAVPTAQAARPSTRTAAPRRQG